jgi:predicted TIM-barrel fold metal-dependent hydrolase
MQKKVIVDAHIHCGPRNFQGIGGFGTVTTAKGKELWNTIEHVKKHLEEAGVRGAVLLPFPEDIQREPYASEQSARTAHDYLAEIGKNNDNFYPFYFVWNDFLIPENLSEFKGIKWHRHDWIDPEYDYSDPRCDEFVKAIQKYKLPIILEESFENTKLFCDKYPDLKVIIPHLGSANGGVRNIISEFKDNQNVYVDTSLAYPFQIVEAILQFGPDRVIFGSDMPYSNAKIELINFLEYELIKQFSDEDIEKIFSKNILKLMQVNE